MRTSDGGATFTSVSPSSTKLLAATFAAGRRVVAAGEDGVTVVSDDAGTTWAPLGGRLSQTFTRIRAVSASLVFAVGPNGTLARTSDGGRSWAPLGVSTSEDVIDVSFADAFVGYAVDAAGTVLRTENGGISWQILNTGYSATPQAVLALDPRTVLLIGGRGVLRSTDGGDTFSRVRARIVAAARLFNVDRAGGRVFAYGSKNIVASSDRGRTWKKVLRPRKALLASLDFVSARTGFVLGQDGQLFKTRNGGRRWADLSGGRLRRRNRHGVQQRVARLPDAVGASAKTRADTSSAPPTAAGPGVRSSCRARHRGPRGWPRSAPSAAFLLADSRRAAVHDLRWRSRRALQGHDSHRAAHRQAAVRDPPQRPGARRARGSAGARGAARARRERLGRPGRHRRVQRHLHDQVACSAKTAAFVAQWAGDEDSAGDGSPALVVRTKRALAVSSRGGGMSRRSRSRVSSSRRASSSAVGPSAAGVRDVRRPGDRAGAPPAQRPWRRRCSNASRGRVTGSGRGGGGRQLALDARGAHHVLAHAQLLRLEARAPARRAAAGAGPAGRGRGRRPWRRPAAGGRGSGGTAGTA